MFEHHRSLARILSTAALVLATRSPLFADDVAVSLPPGVAAVWDLNSAEREATQTRERVCINGLWRWQPADSAPDQPPGSEWGYFKVPGCWPGITNYMQKDCQTLFTNPAWKDQRLSDVSAAWYEREITIPDNWTGRRISITAECVNSLATVFVDGRREGEILFPAGELDVTDVCRPGGKYRLSIHVSALPQRAVLLSYTDSNAAREVAGRVARRGLCGDLFLVSRPAGPRIRSTRVFTSVGKGRVTYAIAAQQLTAGTEYRLDVSYGTEGGLFWSKSFRARDADARIALTTPLSARRLWDVHSPGNIYDVRFLLSDADGNALDVVVERAAFREFWIDGRDFYLNGNRIFLSAVPLDNAQVGAAWAGYEGAKESLLRLKSMGINFVYTHNYGCEPGSHLAFEEILRAADDVGMLVALSQPHFSQYDWQAPDADENNGYARHAAYYVGVAGNHPSVVAYSMSHNACGYGGDMDPDLIDGIHDPRDSNYELRNFNRATRAEAIVKQLDPQRIVYHHAGGNTGAMHTINFYPNFVPIQEMSDWFEHWATEGVKPVFTCEYGAPFLWDWGMYRGWYNGEREFGSAQVPWDFCLAEWDAQFLGDRAFQISDAEQENLRWEARQLRNGRLWHRWDYPYELDSKVFTERYEVIARYLTDNWRSFRTWGMSGVSAWQHGQYWTLRDGVDRGRVDLSVDWQRLQRPGFSADYLDDRYERRDLAYELEDWVPTQAADALLRNNMPLLGWIAGRPDAFTSKDHLFCPGETVEKQVIVINNSREAVTCGLSWSLNLPEPVSGTSEVTVPTGDQARIPLQFDLPASLPPGTYNLATSFNFSTGETQEDAFTLRVIPRAVDPQVDLKIALWDPNGETAALLKEMGVSFDPVDADADLALFDLLIVGKSALTVDGPAPDITRVRDGLRVLIFEQTGRVLEQRFGFRVAEYGLRQVFPRIPDHPALAGISTDQLRDWRGDATLLPPRLTVEMEPRRGPTVQWCGLSVPRLWRCGNRGNVASALIEKPPRGDFLPVVDGGYSLQYSPLMEYRDGRGLVLFCQLDLTGRTDADPAADTLARNLLRYVASWQPPPRRTAMYLGEPAGKQFLESLGLTLQAFDPTQASESILIIGPAAGEHTDDIAKCLDHGGRLLTIGLDEADAKALPLPDLRVRTAEHIAAYFDPPAFNSPLLGIGPADVHNRDPRRMGLVTAGADVLGDGVLADSENANIVLCAIAPWQFGGSEQPNLRKTFRRSSYLVARLLANLGAAGSTPIVERFHEPVDSSQDEKRWEEGLYLDQPEEWDDPYRFFRW